MAEPTETAAVSHSDTESVDAAVGIKSNRPGRDPKLTERDELLARMDQQIADEREAENVRFLSSNTDPRARALAAAMDAERHGEAVSTDRGHRDLEQMTQETDGADSVEAFEEPAKPAQRVSTKGEDPLGKYVVRVEGKPMFKTLVDGKEQLIPLDRAQAQLQKHTAADARLQAAAARQKELDVREAALRAREAAPKSHPSAKAPVVDETALARDVVRSLLTDPEDKAIGKLAQTFKTIRQAATPQIDLEQVRQTARAEARQEIVGERQREAFSEGFEDFEKSYPEIAKDSDLFALADRKSEEVGREHPDWTPGQIMIEAGERTRAWMQSMGIAVKTGPKPIPASTDPRRQQRKENLVPMPQSRGTRVAEPKEEADDDSAAATLAEIRKNRGQPY